MFPEKYILPQHQDYQQFTTQSDNPQDGKTKFKVAARIYLNTHSFHSVDEFVCVKMIHSTVYKVSIVFYIVEVQHIFFVFMSLPISHNL